MNLQNRKTENNVADTIWIIRYKDWKYESHYGTRESAEAIAERKKHLHGGSYIIT